MTALVTLGGYLTSDDGRGLNPVIARAAGLNSGQVSQALTYLERKGLIARDVRGRRVMSVTVLDAPDGPLPPTPASSPRPAPCELGYDDGLADALIRLVRAGHLRGTDAQILADCVGVGRDAMYRARDRTHGHRANGQQTGRTRWR